MQDVPAIAEVAKRHGASVLFDNTWATPLYFKALDHGVDLSIISGTKYLGGHSDVMIGTVAARGEAWKKLKELHGAMGLHVGPDDMFLALRGIRTLAGASRPAWGVLRSRVARWLGSAARSQPRALPAAGKRSRTRALEARHDRRVRPLRDGARRMERGGGRQIRRHLTLFGIGASWAGSRASSPCPTSPGRRRAGRRKGRSSASISASKTRPTSSPISTPPFAHVGRGLTGLPAQRHPQRGGNRLASWPRAAQSAEHTEAAGDDASPLMKTMPASSHRPQDDVADPEADQRAGDDVAWEMDVESSRG